MKKAEVKYMVVLVRYRDLFLFILATYLIVGCGPKAEKIPKKYKAKSHLSQVRYRATMRPYCVRGRYYYPCRVSIGDTMRGISSWYGPNFHGKKTSSGEIYNMYAHTAAHKTWPIGTVVRVTNLENGRKTVVRINDRGPFVKGRVIDCSYRAGKELGLDRTGIAKVKLEVIGLEGRVSSKAAALKERVYRRDRRLPRRDFGLQVSAFRSYESAKSFLDRYADSGMRSKAVISKGVDKKGQPLYRVLLSGFGSKEEAQSFKRKYALADAFVVSTSN